MLSVSNAKIPRIVAIRVAKAEKLVPSKKDNKKKLNTKFRVVVLGGKKKEHSELVEDSNGNPEWGFSCMLKRQYGSPEPVILLVEDSEGHHKGQVVIPLVKIGPKPYTYSPDQSPATSSNLICSELEPTKKYPTASGFLIYWIWTEEYCQEQDTASRSSFNKSVTSLFGSKKTLGSSKNRLSFPAGSTSNISSGVTLNKPETHKKTLSFLHIKSKKDKSKKSVPENKKSPDSSDIDDYNEPGNPFDNSPSRGLDYQFNAGGNPFDGVPTSGGSVQADRADVMSHSSNGSIFERGSLPRNDDVPEIHTSSLNITPLTLPPVDKPKSSPRTLPPIKDANTVPTTLLGKSNLANQQIPDKSTKENTPVIDSQSSPEFQPSHKSTNDSINSLFNDHSEKHQSIPIIKADKDETDFFLKENPVSEYVPSSLSITPETLPPVDFNPFKKPFPKSIEPTLPEPIKQTNVRSSFDNRHTYQQDISDTPTKKVDQRSPATMKFVPNSEYSTPFGEQSPIAVKLPEYHSAAVTIAPVTMPPVEVETLFSKSPVIGRQTMNKPSPNLPRKPFDQTYPNSNDTYQQGIDTGLSRNPFEQRYQPVASDETDLLRKENSELKSQNNKSIQRISELQSELDYVKDSLFKLRTKLLEEGAMKFLEKL